MNISFIMSLIMTLLVIQCGEGEGGGSEGEGGGGDGEGGGGEGEGGDGGGGDGGGDGGSGGEDGLRSPQSVQSVPNAQRVNS